MIRVWEELGKACIDEKQRETLHRCAINQYQMHQHLNGQPAANRWGWLSRGEIGEVFRIMNNRRIKGILRDIHDNCWVGVCT